MNRNKLEAKFKENGLNQSQVAQKIGISPNSLCRKLGGKQEFKLSEVVSLCKTLGIEDPVEIFLS